MLFDPLESVVLFFAGMLLFILYSHSLTQYASVLVTNYVVADGKSNWLEGAILFFLYVICAIIFWYYPGMFPSSVYVYQDNITLFRH
jgi:Ca2+:H+ antiporter